MTLGSSEKTDADSNVEKKLDVVMKDDYSYFERFLQSQGILTAPSQLPSAGSATISPDESVLGALNIMHRLSENKHFYHMPFWRYREIAAADLYFVGTWYKCLRTLLSLVSQPWWERVWIVQEAVLSPNAIVNIGRHQVFLSLFFPAARNYIEHCESCCVTWTRLWHGRCDISLPLGLKMRLVKDLGNVISNNAAGRLVPVSLALLSQRREATDPRDHFYAITGLMKHPFTRQPLGPVPDYRVDSKQLFQEQTLNLMQQSGSISLLLRGAVGVGAFNPHRLPSWAIDWSYSRRTSDWLSSLYNASNGHQHKFHHSTDGIFIIAGAALGVVSKLGNIVNRNDVEDVAVKVEEWQHLAGTDQPFDIRTVLKATFMDITMRIPNQPRRLTPDDVTLIEEWWWQWIIRMKRLPGPIESPDIWQANSDFGYHMNRDRVFVTREGHFGVGPRTLSFEDRIFIVQGAKVPLILRPLEGSLMEASSTLLGSRDYSYVGRCYLHGCMDGEAVTSETKWQTLNLH